DALFSMVARMHEHVDEDLKPKTGAANAKELSFPLLDSGYIVSSATSAQSARGSTIQLLHASEVAFWEGASFEAISQALSDAPGTEAILESTANGVGGLFHSLWVAAEAGESQFLPIFLPWYHDESYRLEAPLGWKPPAEFVEYGKANKLDAAQLRWFYQKNAD